MSFFRTFKYPYQKKLRFVELHTYGIRFTLKQSLQVKDAEEEITVKKKHAAHQRDHVD